MLHCVKYEAYLNRKAEGHFIASQRELLLKIMSPGLERENWHRVLPARHLYLLLHFKSVCVCVCVCGQEFAVTLSSYRTDKLLAQKYFCPNYGKCVKALIFVHCISAQARLFIAKGSLLLNYPLSRYE